MQARQIHLRFAGRCEKHRASGCLCTLYHKVAVSAGWLDDPGRLGRSEAQELIHAVRSVGHLAPKYRLAFQRVAEGSVEIDRADIDTEHGLHVLPPQPCGPWRV